MLHSARWGAHDYRFICEETTLVCDHGTLRDRDDVRVEGDGEDMARGRQDRAFVDAVVTGCGPPVSVDAVLPAMRVLSAAWAGR